MKRSKLARFSLRSLFLLVTQSCLAMGLWAVYVQPFRLQAQAVVLIEKSQGSVTFEPASGSALQQWLVVRLLGKEQYVQVTSANLRNTEASQTTLQSLRNLIFLRQLNLDGNAVDDELLEEFPRLTHLQKLSLRYTAVTDADIESLRNLDQLEELFLTGTNVSDDCANTLVSMTNLRKLHVRWTKITPAGADLIKAALPKCDVQLYGTVASR